MGPLSGKQQREWLKHHAKESRESAKMEAEESRKQALHEIKLQEAAAKANQGLGHKEELHGIKVNELGGPLSGKKPKMNKQKLGIPTQNPLAGTEVFSRGQHKLPFAQGTDTVPAMLTPGEAVIPAPAAQDPRNKPLIKKMVEQGRKMQHHARGTTGVIDLPHQLAMIPKVGARKKPMGYSNGTVEVDDVQRYMPDKYVEGSVGIVDPSHRKYYDGTTGVGLTMADINKENQTGIAPYGLRYMESSTDQVMPKGSGYVGEIPMQNGNIATELSVSDDKGQYPTIVPTLSKEEVATVVNLDAGQDVPQSITNKAELYRDSRVAQGQSAFADNVGLKAPIGAGDNLYKEGQPAPVPLTDVAAVPKQVQDDQYNPDVKQGQVPAPTPMTAADVNNMDRRALAAEVPAPASTAATPVATRSIAPPKADRTNPNYWIQQLRDSQPQVDALASKHGNNEKGFVDSFKNLFSYSGVKDILGLNNQEVARMAVMYLGSRARGYDGARSLSFAGRNAFETSLQRQNREAQETASDRRAEKTDQRAIRSSAVQLAEKYRHEQETERKAELNRILADKKELRKQVENDMDRYENFASKDVPAAVRNQAAKIAYAPLKATDPEERIQEQRNNLRDATVLLANNTMFKDPNSTRHDRAPKWGWYEDDKGNAVFAAPDPYGSGNMIVKTPDGKFCQIGGEKLRTEGTTAKQGETVAKITKEYLSGTKGTDGKPIDTSAVGAKIMTAMQDFPGLASNPYRANPAIEQTVKLLAQDESKEFSSDAVRKALTASTVMTLTPTNSDLFMTPGKNAQPVSGKSAVDFGGALMKAKDKNGNPVPLEAASNLYINQWAGMNSAEKAKFNNLARPGYSGFQEFVIKDIAKQK